MYKLKFLERIEKNKKGNKAEEKFMTVSCGENDIPNMAKHWKAMGFVELREVIAQKGARLIPAQVVEKLYDPEVTPGFDNDDKLIKESLLQKYKSGKSKRDENPDQVPDELKDMDKEEEKKLRKKLFDALKEKDIKVVYNIKTPDLIVKAKENDIEL